MTTTGENNGLGNNMPSIAIEIVPRLDSPPATFTTMVYTPANASPQPLPWTTYNAVTDPAPHWGLTGSAFAGTPCDINGARCTWTQLTDYLDDGAPDATILTVQITKGRDFAFSGAVDNLRINDTIYDFEPTGVYETPAP